MANHAGEDRAHREAEPDWFRHAEVHMMELFTALEEINDPTCYEAFVELEDALSAAKKRKK